MWGLAANQGTENGRYTGTFIIEITDPFAPVAVVPASLGTESNDITFNADGTRAYSAALSQGVIIDAEDPANPQILSNWAVQLPQPLLRRQIEAGLPTYSCLVTSQI